MFGPLVINLFNELLTQAFDINNATEYQVSTQSALLDMKRIEDQLIHVGYEAQKQLLRSVYSEQGNDIAVRCVSNPTNRLYIPLSTPKQEMKVTLIGNFKFDENGQPLLIPKTVHQIRVNSGKYWEKIQETMALMLGTEFENAAALEFTHRLLSIDKKTDNKPSCVDFIGGCKDWVLFCGKYQDLAHIVTGHPYNKRDLRSLMPVKTSFVTNNKPFPEVTRHLELKVMSPLNIEEVSR